MLSLMSQFRENLWRNGRMDGRTDRPYFVGPFQLHPRVQKTKKTFQAQLGAPKFCSCVLPLLVVRRCLTLSFYEISKKTNEPNLKK